MHAMEPRDQTLMNLAMSLTRISRAYKSAADRLASQFGLSHATAWPVIMIGRLGDGVRTGAVADALGLDPSSLVRVVDQLIEAGLVLRQNDASDRRARNLHLSVQGRELAEQLEATLVLFRRQVFKGATQADLDACQRVFERLDTGLAAYEIPCEPDAK